MTSRPLRTRPLLSGLIQQTKTNGQWRPKYVQITVDINSYASAMYVYDKKHRRYAKDNRTAHLTARSDKSVAYVTNNKRLYSTFCTVEANYWQTRSIARPLCDGRATCFIAAIMTDSIIIAVVMVMSRVIVSPYIYLWRILVLHVHCVIHTRCPEKFVWLLASSKKFRLVCDFWQCRDVKR